MVNHGQVAVTLRRDRLCSKLKEEVSMAKAKKGDYLSCDACGLVVVVDEACGCAVAEVICCDKPMAPGKAAANRAKKKAGAPKPAAKAVKAAKAKPAKAAAKAKPVKAAKAKPAAKKPVQAKK
jgi:hypothetical protein